MSDTSQGPGWWKASDGKWYPPQSQPAQAAPPPPSPTQAPSYAQAAPTYTQAPPYAQAPPQSYGTPGAGPSWAPAAKPRTNGTAIAAFIFAFVFWPVGIILGHVSRRQIRQRGEGGGGLALAALIISYVWGALLILIIVIAIVASNSQATGYNDLNTLQQSVTQQENQSLSNQGDSGSVTSTLCAHSGGTQYSCVVKFSDGSSNTLSITVSTDGTRWVTNRS